MESLKGTVKFCFRAEVVGIKERFTKTYIKGIGEDAVFEDRSQGWFLTFEGSHEAIHIGTERPNVKVGAIAAITIEIPKGA